MTALAGAGGTATAAGAAAGAATAGAGIGGALQTIGLLASVGGSFVQGIQAKKTAEAQADALEVQRQEEARLNAVEDYRTRKKMRAQTAQQRAGFAARGVSAGSPTAIYLGQTAAQELAFASQSVRQRGAATDTELSNSARLVRAQGKQSMIRGMFSGAGRLLRGAPEVWPELLA
ncbi:hypothetical protein [Palleronia pelagia]|uniref:hypothetical protein n=1 Tax=Palleronia pelagia TaxID=387096 RepID=UPI0015873E02|nr:hypothetical protein [Palleronia pelagia]